MKNRIKITLLLIFLILVVNSIEILNADDIDEILEEVDKDNWKNIVEHRIKNPVPLQDSEAIMSLKYDLEKGPGLVGHIGSIKYRVPF